MKTKIYRQSESLVEAAEILKNGGLVAFPTETVYGLGANALDSNAAAKIYAAKGRPSDNPLIIHLSDPADADKYAHVCKEYEIISKCFMPGPITVVLPKKDNIPSEVTGGLSTVAVRVPSNETARRLISLAGVPVAAPSANISGKPSCTTFAHVAEDMDGRIDAIIDGEDCVIGLESTIVLPDGDMTLRLLRPGAITYEMLTNAGFTVLLDKAVVEKLSDGEKPLAPGMKYRHYAPGANVILVQGTPDTVSKFLYEKSNEDDVSVILFDEEKEMGGKNAVYLGAEKNEEEQAQKLFALLRSFDKNNNIKTVYARVPSRERLGLAIYNRLVKASGYTIISI